MALQLKQILEQRKMSILALSKATGITQANLSNIANGKASPKLDILERIAEALGMEVWELLKDDNEKSSVSFRCPRCGTTFDVTFSETDNTHTEEE